MRNPDVNSKACFLPPCWLIGLWPSGNSWEIIDLQFAFTAGHSANCNYTHFQLSMSGEQTYSIHTLPPLRLPSPPTLPPTCWLSIQRRESVKKQKKDGFMKSMFLHNRWWVKCARTPDSLLNWHCSYTHIYTQTMGVIQRRSQESR